jgi:hypothetical protein
MLIKFKNGQLVKYTESKTKFKVVRSYPTEMGRKYDIISLDGQKYPKGVMEIELENVDTEGFPCGMDEELTRMGKNKKK